MSDALDDRTGLHWKWVIGGALIMLLTQVVTYGGVQVMIMLDALADQDTMSRNAALAVGGILGFPLGGYAIGRLSDEFTVWEPAIASTISAICYTLMFHADFSSLALVGIMVVGFATSILAASKGEQHQAE